MGFSLKESDIPINSKSFSSAIYVKYFYESLP